MKKHLYYLVFALSYQQRMIFQFADRFLLELPHQHFLFFNLFLTLFLLTYIHLYTIAAKSPAFAGLFDKFLASIYSCLFFFCQLFLYITYMQGSRNQVFRNDLSDMSFSDKRRRNCLRLCKLCHSLLFLRFPCGRSCRQVRRIPNRRK